VKAGDLTLRHASELMGVSYRHTKRLWKRIPHEGSAGLQHRGVGRRLVAAEAGGVAPPGARPGAA